MDLDYLCQRHQLSLHLARRATCAASRAAHEGLAGHYQRLIDEIGSGRGSGTASGPSDRVGAAR